MRPCPPDTGDSARAQRKARERPEFFVIGLKAGRWDSPLPGVGIHRWLVRQGCGFWVLSSLNRARNSRSASTGSSGSVISNGVRVSRMPSDRHRAEQ
jgi:hypothetical protein